MAIVRMSWSEAQNRPVDEAELMRLRALKDEDIDFSDIPELTESDFSRAVPFTQILEMRKKARQVGGAVIVIENRVLQKFQDKAKKTGADCQQMIDLALEEYLLSH